MTKYNGPNGPHPRHGNALSGAPITLEGHVFRPYRSGVLTYSRCSDDFRVEVYRLSRRSSYTAIVDGKLLPTRFRSERRAFEAAIAIVYGKPLEGITK